MVAPDFQNMLLNLRLLSDPLASMRSYHDQSQTPEFGGSLHNGN
jgi:hypothetical protein